MSNPEASLPVHAKDNPNTPSDGAPSKNALKKAQKDAEKAAKKAAVKKAEDEKRAQQQASADDDNAKTSLPPSVAAPTSFAVLYFLEPLFRMYSSNSPSTALEMVKIA